MTEATEATEELATLLGRARVPPVLRAGAASEALAVAQDLVRDGLPVIEFTATTPQWWTVLASAVRDWPQLCVGLGTVLDADTARRALDCGAAFLVSPFPVPAARAACEATATPFVEGGFTPAELAAATSRGIAKYFPAHVGGTAALRSMLSVLPGARIVPTGGIEPDEARSWIEAGALAVGIGGALGQASGRRRLLELLASW